MLLTWTLATVSVGAFMLLARVKGGPTEDVPVRILWPSRGKRLCDPDAKPT
jgi:hypothetical protein